MDLVAAFRFLNQQLRDEGELGDDPVAQRSGGDVVEVTAQVAHDSAGVTLQRLQCLAHPPKRPGMSMAANLQRQPGRQACIALAQLHPGLPRQRRQLRPRPLIKPGVGGVRDVLFHHGRIDCHALEAGVVDGPGFAPGRHGLGQQPVHTFFADPRAPPRQGRRVDGKPVLKRSRR